MQWTKNGGDAVAIDFVIFFRERAPSLYDSGKSDRRFSKEQEGKLLYAARTTRETNLVEFRQLQKVGIFSYLR